MATDVDQLRAGLGAYRDSLSQHLSRLSTDFCDVQRAWAALDQEYAGRAAEEFRQRWRITAEWFEQYMDAIRNLSTTLEERSRNLQRL
jgi:uncharacterized protein YukE